MKKQKLKKYWYLILVGRVFECVAMVALATTVLIALFLMIPEQEHSEDWYACRENVIQGQRNAERYNME